MQLLCFAGVKQLWPGESSKSGWEGEGLFFHDVDVTEKVSEKVLLKEGGGGSRIKGSMVVKKYI